MRGRLFFLFLLLAVVVVTGLSLPALAQTLTITAPLDQAHLDLTYGEYFDVSWTCTRNTTGVEP